MEVLEKVCNRIEQEPFFYETATHYKDILNKYEEVKDDVIQVTGPWTFMPMYDLLGMFPAQYELFYDVCKNMPDSAEYTILAMGISSIKGEDGMSPHKDNHPTDGRFKRFHLALQLTATSRICVYFSNNTSGCYSWELGNWMEFNGVSLKHFPKNEEDTPRILFIVDVFVGDINDTDLMDYYTEIARLGWISEDFIPNYTKYINKEL